MHTFTKYFRIVCLLAVMLLIPVSVLPQDVVQGKCTAVDAKHDTITIHEFNANVDSLHRYGREIDTIMQYDVSRAKVGIPPEVGDILRIVYVMDEDIRKVLRVMNVSKQDSMNN